MPMDKAKDPGYEPSTKNNRVNESVSDVLEKLNQSLSDTEGLVNLLISEMIPVMDNNPEYNENVVEIPTNDSPKDSRAPLVIKAESLVIRMYYINNGINNIRRRMRV